MTTVDRSSLSPLSWAVIGAGGGLVGLLLWLITGARLPLQNLGDAATLDTPIALRDLFTFAPDGLSPLASALVTTLRWMPAVLVGAVIAWCGFRTIGRVVAVVVSIAALWIGPAFFTAVGNAAGSRNLAHNPLEMLDYGVGVFWAALGTVDYVVPTLLVAMIIGAFGAATRAIVRRRRLAEHPADSPPVQ